LILGGRPIRPAFALQPIPAAGRPSFRIKAACEAQITDFVRT
jgi:hypothetical protein